MGHYFLDIQYVPIAAGTGLGRSPASLGLAAPTGTVEFAGFPLNNIGWYYLGTYISCWPSVAEICLAHT